jgi:hypothetical protein
MTLELIEIYAFKYSTTFKLLSWYGQIINSGYTPQSLEDCPRS